ncbi:MAG: hypothetical protein WDZ41_03060 [Candidatus Babeliales bacterium]
MNKKNIRVLFLVFFGLATSQSVFSLYKKPGTEYGGFEQEESPFGRGPIIVKPKNFEEKLNQLVKEIKEFMNIQEEDQAYGRGGFGPSLYTAKQKEVIQTLEFLKNELRKRRSDEEIFGKKAQF